MLPNRLTEGHIHQLQAGSTADVVVRLEGSNYLTIGRYLHELEEWQVNGWNGAPVVEEWWPLPEVGTGNKP